MEVDEEGFVIRSQHRCLVSLAGLAEQARDRGVQGYLLLPVSHRTSS